MSFLREPFVHFLLIGAAVFGAGASLGPDSPQTRERIVVNDAVVESIVARWQAVWHRPPSVEELRGEVEEHVRQQVLYREGLAMGLDRDDIVIQRRIVQKVEFLAADIADAAPVTDDELRAFYDAHPERYTAPGTVSFRQVLFSKDARGDQAGPDAEVALGRVRSGELTDFAAVSQVGDHSLLPPALKDADRIRVSGRFGDAFADAVTRAVGPGWLEVVPSTFGAHVVEVLAVSGAQVEPFERVRERIRGDVETERRRAANETMYRRIREQYEVVVETQVAGLAPGLSPREGQ